MLNDRMSIVNRVCEGLISVSALDHASIAVQLSGKFFEGYTFRR